MNMVFLVLLSSTSFAAYEGGANRHYGVGEKCAITLNGNPAKLSDLRRGDVLWVDGQPAVTIKATRSEDQ